jgi:Uma2 family endonuclease
MVACDRSPESAYYREEPILVVEILSPSTERTDRNEKLTVYKNISTLQEYVIVWQEKMQIEIYRRQPDGNWLTYIYSENDADEGVELQSINLKIKIEEIYRRVRFEN